MTKETLEYIKAKTSELISAPSCYAGLRDAASAYLDAVGTDREKDAAAAYIAELNADVTSIDGLIAFAGSERGEAVFGAEAAAKMLSAAKAAKADGEKYCICAACQAGAAVLSKKDEILG